MAGGTSYMTAGGGNPAITVIGPQFSAPSPVGLTIVRKVLNITDGNFEVTDVNGNIMFKVNNKILSLHDRRVLLDASGNPLVSLRAKTMTAHGRCQVYRGESSDSKDVLFSVKQPSIIQFKTELDVFLASNSTEKDCDFKIKGSGPNQYTIFAGNSSTIIAQCFERFAGKGYIRSDCMPECGLCIYRRSCGDSE